jgi:hypothetical protein
MKDGQHYYYRKLEFWAENGLINIVDERFPPEDDRSFVVRTRVDFLQKLAAFSTELKKCNFKYADERNEHITFLENGTACAREAKKQGCPDDPEAMADMLRHRRRNYSFGTGQSVVTHAAAAEGTPENELLPPIPTARSV